jgi:signal transduction histidine kinase
MLGTTTRSPGRRFPVTCTSPAGMTVELSAPRVLDKVPPSAGLCAYRIIQEALSNAGRHAAGAPVEVSVDHVADTITLQVTNGPGVPAEPRANGHAPGHGLAGMRERVELLGGSLSAEPAPDGGFADLPSSLCLRQARTVWRFSGSSGRTAGGGTVITTRQPFGLVVVGPWHCRGRVGQGAGALQT